MLKEIPRRTIDKPVFCICLLISKIKLNWKERTCTSWCIFVRAYCELSKIGRISLTKQNLLPKKWKFPTKRRKYNQNPKKKLKKIHKIVSCFFPSKSIKGEHGNKESVASFHLSKRFGTLSRQILAFGRGKPNDELNSA